MLCTINALWYCDRITNGVPNFNIHPLLAIHREVSLLMFDFPVIGTSWIDILLECFFMMLHSELVSEQPGTPILCTASAVCVASWQCGLSCYDAIETNPANLGSGPVLMTPSLTSLPVVSFQF